jgi:predicted permease
MRRLRVVAHRLRSLFRRGTVEDELDRELQIHLDALTQEHVANGMSEADARIAARRAFGSPEQVKDECRDQRRTSLLDDLVADVRYALRLMARSPGFAATAIVSLALGIGANTAIFSLIDTVLLRLLPVARPNELVFLQAAGSERRGGAPPYPCFERLRAETSAFTGMAAFATDELRFGLDGGVEQAFSQVVSGNYFELLGLEPAAGRLLRLDDEKLDPPVAVISHGYWQSRFGGAADVIGRTITSGDRVYTIVGVTPPEFWGLNPGREVLVTLPIGRANPMLRDAGAWWFEAVARVRPGVNLEQAAAQADTVFQSFMKDRDRSREDRRKFFDHLELTPAARGLDRLRERFSRPLMALASVAGLVLLVACANLGSLLLARGAARERELAIRLATGAGRGRLLRQLLTETLLLFGLGALAGLLVAHLAIQGLTGFFAIGRNPIRLDVQYDWRLAAFAAAVALGTGLFTGLWPALRALRTDPQAAMKEGESRLAGSRTTGRAGRVLVTGQVALSLVLLVVALMFTRTMAKLAAVDLGFDQRNVLTLSIDPVLRGDAVPEQRQRFWKATLERVRSLPGVRGAGLAVLTPLSGRDTGRSVSISGYSPLSEMDLFVRLNHVSDGYFETLGMTLLAGRVLSERDTKDAAKVAVINEAAAETYFPNRSPLGETLGFGAAGAYQVVGVVRNHKHRSVREQPQRFVFIPLWQPLDNLGRVTLAVASAAPPSALAAAVSREIRAVHPQTLIADVLPLDEQIAATLTSERLLSLLAAVFAALALALSGIGLFGTMSYAVARRTPEFGIRMALGADPAAVARSIYREAGFQLGAGLVIGLPAALAAASAARALLFGVTPADLQSYALGAMALATVVGLACGIPAWRAAQTTPSDALRRG